MKKPKIVVLCGSTKFRDEFHKENRRLTLEGCIVLGPGVFGHADDLEEPITDEQKKALDDLHLHKIDIAKEVFVINVGGYIGESTRREIEYAQHRQKKIVYLSQVASS